MAIAIGGCVSVLLTASRLIGVVSIRFAPQAKVRCDDRDLPISEIAAPNLPRLNQSRHYRDRFKGEQ
jgi:hypothetical protein